MKKIFALFLSAVFVLSLCSCSFGETETTTASETEEVNLFSADLSFDVLAEILREKGDAIHFSSIPEQYFYVIPNTAIPQICYPIHEKANFRITMIGENQFSLMLSIENEDGSVSSYDSAEEILDYIDSLQA